MHGLFITALKCFVQDSYAAETWDAVLTEAELETLEFEAMLTYETVVPSRLIDITCDKLGKQETDLYQDIGHYLVTHPSAEPVRRLLRFGGATFVEFLWSLEDLHDRVRFAVADLDMGRIEIADDSRGVYRAVVHGGFAGFIDVLDGMLRAMSDDYGTLVSIDRLENSEDGKGQLRIELHEIDFAQGREFDLVGSFAS